MSLTPETSLTATIRRLHTHIRSHPNSPLFARLANYYIETEDTEKALKVCLEGLKNYPHYQSAHLVLAKTYLMLRRYHDAREALKRVLELQPTSSMAYSLHKKSFELEEKYPPMKKSIFDQVVDDRVISPPHGVTSTHRRWSHDDSLIPGAHQFKEKEIEPETSPHAGMRSELEELNLEQLAVELEHAKIPVIVEYGGGTIPSGLQTTAESNEIESRPITETLASIYVQQGRYEEAIRAYKILEEKFPDRTTEFREIIHKLVNQQKHSS